MKQNVYIAATEVNIKTNIVKDKKKHLLQVRNMIFTENKIEIPYIARQKYHKSHALATSVKQYVPKAVT